ncbi:hypothetical protein D3C72_2343730 [compost metagenome]
MIAMPMEHHRLSLTLGPANGLGKGFDEAVTDRIALFRPVEADMRDLAHALIGYEVRCRVQAHIGLLLDQMCFDFVFLSIVYKVIVSL